MWKESIKHLLRQIALGTPDIKYIRAIPTQVLWKLHNWLRLGGGVVEVGDFRMHLDPKEYIDGTLWFAPHQYDKLERRFILEHIPSNATGWFVDLGANIGFISLWLAVHFPHAQVLSIEAFPRTYNKLVENIIINRLKNIIPVQVGVLDMHGKLPFYFDPTYSGNASLIREVCESAHQNIQEVVEVDVVPLDTLFSQHAIDRCNLIKLDIEGAEERVLRRFFECAPSSVYPDYLWVEHLHSPHLHEIVEPFGYRQCMRTKMNVIYERVKADEKEA